MLFFEAMFWQNPMVSVHLAHRRECKRAEAKFAIVERVLLRFAMRADRAGANRFETNR